MSNTKKTNTASPRKRPRQKEGTGSNLWLLFGGITVMILAALILIVTEKKKITDQGDTKAAGTEAAETLSSSVLHNNYMIDMSGLPGFSSGNNISARKGMHRQEILDEAAALYKWNVVITNDAADVGAVVKPTVDPDVAVAQGSEDQIQPEVQGFDDIEGITVTDTIVMPDFIEHRLLSILDEVFADDERAVSLKRTVAADDEESREESYNVYIMDLEGLEDAIESVVKDAGDMWYVEAKGGSIGSYDAENDEFIMEGSSDGVKIDKEKLFADLKAKLEKGDFECVIPVSTEVISAEDSVKNGDYTIISSYVTHTTGNAVRNNNIRIACEKLNGTIVRPGEEFSYNYVIGERTEEKGYGTAAAYANGEVVQEIGGGVCQLSSTLYNAVTEAGLKTTARYSHTFKPTYITPGQDATISWNGPDYRFANVIALPDISYDTTYAIGIKSRYADRTVTVEIYGRPIFKPGYKVSMESEMTGESELVRQLIPPEDTEKQPTTGDKGSIWRTYLLVTKDDQQISKDIYHTTSYKGHTEYYREEEPTSESESESLSEQESESYTGPIGPGMPTPPQTEESGGPWDGPTIPQTGGNTVGPGPNPEGETPQIIDAPPGFDHTSPGAPGDIIQDGP